MMDIDFRSWTAEQVQALSDAYSRGILDGSSEKLWMVHRDCGMPANVEWDFCPFCGEPTEGRCIELEKPDMVYRQVVRTDGHDGHWFAYEPIGRETFERLDSDGEMARFQCRGCWFKFAVPKGVSPNHCPMCGKVSDR